MRFFDIRVAAMFGYLVLVCSSANAAVVYGYNDNCISDCGPVGVLGSTVTDITGSMTLDVPVAPDGGQFWKLADVLSYSFTYGTFTIDNNNSTLSTPTGDLFSTEPVFPFTGKPFSAGQVLATYTLDSDVVLLMSPGGLNLVQNNEPACTLNQCQTLGSVQNTDWFRITPVPLPAAFWLFGASLGLLGWMRRTAT